VEELKVETEKLKEAIEDLKEKKKSVTLPEVDDEVLVEDKNEGIIIENPATKPDVPGKEEPFIIEFPSGMIIEIDEDGNIIRTIKEAPIQASITPTTEIPASESTPTNISEQFNYYDLIVEKSSGYGIST
ncbi:hypothetical protein MYX76_18780, partial [Desulfobacterota bacterium AH_259_B03_O07]|nr:hypothetical protein [Desulfobacterota bacterium AH_259_B03_O07]